MRPTKLLLLLPLLAACLGSDPGTSTPPGGEEGPTYYTDVKPILETYCTRCHNEAGQGPGNFLDPETVLDMGEMIAGVTAAGLMPPPAADPDCSDYEGSERFTMPDEAITTLGSWVDAGKPLGDQDQAVEVVPWELDIEDADTIFEMSHAYTPTFSDPNNPGNEYRCFVLENTRTEPFYVTDFAPILGVPEIVHHIVVFLKDKDDNIAGYDEETGVDCIDNVAVGAERMLAAWAPGLLPVRLPEGRGIQIRPNQELVVQMHYFDNGSYDGTPDLSGYAMKTAEDVDVPLLMIPAGANGFTIPAGDDSYTHSESFSLPDGVSGKIYTVFPHMHILGTGYELAVEHTDGSESCVVRGDAYDFDNQLSYQLRDPIAVQGGDTIRQTCTWNNSESNPDLIHFPPINTGYGERTDEEMCFTFILASLFEI